ncbi:MAG: acyl-CoA thioesterase [Acidobacteria bacterium]|nr:acyl-CoA thioesterase [Acidobacteriota bacterium]
MTDTPSRLPQAISVRVRYAETDKMGVVYHANYFVWFEVGRCELLRTIGRSYRDLEETGIGLPVIEAHCEYKMPARYDDELQVKTWGALLSPARVEFRYEVSRPADGTTNAVGRTVHASVDATGRPCRLPDYVLDHLR